jgi:hypothetical protein
MPLDLPNALDQIDQIRRQMTRGQMFRGYRAQTTALTGVLTFAAAAVQARFIAQPWEHLPSYFFLWGGLAIFSAALFATEQIRRCRRLASPLQTQRSIEAAERFIPSLAAGGVLTAVYYCYITHAVWMLPGLWAVCFSLGIFASRTLLPRGISIVAGYYLLAGAATLVMARGPHALSPWAMGLTFGVGQLLAAAVLYWNLERK